MKQLLLTLTILTVSAGLIAAVVIGSKDTSSSENSQSSTSPSEAALQANLAPIGEEDILYWGTTCPYCHDTIKWIEENDPKNKLNVTLKEVYENQENSLDLSAKAKSCGMNERQIGVPLMYTKTGECLIGTPDITAYLQAQLELPKEDVVEAEDSSASAKIDQDESQVEDERNE